MINPWIDFAAVSMLLCLGRPADSAGQVAALGVKRETKALENTNGLQALI